MKMSLRFNKRFLLSFPVLISCVCIAFGQTTYPVEDLRKTPVTKEVIIVESPTAESAVSVGSVEFKPQFPEGDKAMFEWIAKNLTYPADASELGITGKVIVSFIVEKDGSVTNAKIIRSLYPSIDKEALRLVNAMPRWTPGKMYGEPVRVTYLLPINFSFK